MNDFAYALKYFQSIFPQKPKGRKMDKEERFKAFNYKNI